MRKYIRIQSLLSVPDMWLAILITMIFPLSVAADNAIDFGMTCSGQHDTIFVGKQVSLDMYIENDVRLGAISLYFEIFSDDGATWQWGGDRYWYEFMPESRMPDGSIWDLGLGWPVPYDTNGISPDTIQHGGVALNVGLEPGPLEHMLSYNLVLDIPDSQGIYELCIDSISIPPAGVFVFTDFPGNILYPTVLWGSGGACWPVMAATGVCGDVNGDGSFNVGDPVFLIAFIFKGGPEPPSMRLADVNGDGTVNVGDAVYMLSNIFKYGPDPICP